MQPGPWQIFLVLLVILLLFGAPKLPGLARSIGQSLRILKDETKSLADGDEGSKTDAAQDDTAKDSSGNSAPQPPHSDDEARDK